MWRNRGAPASSPAGRRPVAPEGVSWFRSGLRGGLGGPASPALARPASRAVAGSTAVELQQLDTSAEQLAVGLVGEPARCRQRVEQARQAFPRRIARD